MLQKRTVFVLGAGASKELGFPLGSELQSLIYQRLRLEAEALQTLGPQSMEWERHPISLGLAGLGNQRTAIRAAIQKVMTGILDSPSIDTFLYNNSSDDLMIKAGKLAILAAILQSEKSCFAADEHEARRHFESLKINNRYGVPWDTFSVQQSYINVIWNQISQSHTTQDAEGIFDRVAFVNFNYDRSLEYVLKRKLERVFPDVTPDRINSIIDALQIVRPYGSPTGPKPYSAARLQFAAHTYNLHEHVDSIRTFTEAIDESVGQNIRALVENCEVLVILGFGFHLQNMDLLTIKRCRQKAVYFSSMGESESNQDALKNQISIRLGSTMDNGIRLSNGEIQAWNGTSKETLSAFSHSIFR